MNKRLQVYTAKISTVDGPGERVALFLAGCPIHCDGCQNRHMWDPQSGVAVDVDSAAAMVLQANRPITISGGEPFAQADAVADLICELKLQDPKREIIVYSGYTLQELLGRAITDGSVAFILHNADILVDGPYVVALDNDKMQWRGSSNQRPIDLRHSVFRFDQGRAVHVELLDWDTQVLQITPDGAITGTAGQMAELFKSADLEPIRRCGQTD
jgi:anaerobic ribonucleoside-triphosphate reductase activating protein